MEIPINKILEKYTINSPDRTVRKEVSRVLKDAIGVDVFFKDVSYRKGRIFVDTSPLNRSQILIHKEKILKELKIRLEKQSIKDIS